MGREHSKKRSMRIKIAQKRRLKLAKLRQKYQAAKSLEEKDKILAKVFKMAPWLTKEEFTTKISKLT